VMGDVRDLPHDTRAGTLTIPRRYGTRWASLFLIVNEILAYGFALSVHWVGALGPGYLYCVIGIVGAGTIINTIFVIRPTPPVADVTNKISFMLLGTLYVLSMVLGK
jgi:4-hydroxybenzoate polyprenyltransferase